LVLADDTGDQAYYVDMCAHFGLDRPITEQLLGYLLNVAQGDLGSSFHYRQPVIQVILSRLPATLLLMGTALVCATGFGLWLGALAGHVRAASMNRRHYRENGLIC
jgi:peptide/nickel transport system permease protein